MKVSLGEMKDSEKETKDSGKKKFASTILGVVYVRMIF